MRKHQREQTENFIELLGQAHDEIDQAIQLRNSQYTIELLEQCQAGAIELGNLIEQSEGEGFVTVTYLEEYCERIYQIHNDVTMDTHIDHEDIKQKLNEILIKIENSIFNDIKIHYEVVFLPYKATMWDSMESVWMAADADSECKTYVVPIPYYERNADGTLGTYHYEGNDFPENVAVTHYDSYHLDQRQPDAIYIHNPYDGANYVTTIDPRYYSKELKKYTDLLIYIPYFATSGGMSEAQSLCPAYLYADYIVIQSEKFRKFYDAAIPDDKFIPLGSPKFDKVIRLCKNPPDPPEKWKSKLHNRKVYFFNTSINGMLANTDAFLKKMKYVFDCFEGRTDSCLLWRPHPLLEASIDSMRSGYLPQYKELKEYFIENDLGIYDDTPDIEETIAYCDAYIGDSATSVTSLFGIAGKPLFILNNFIHTAPEEEDWRGEIIRGFILGASLDWIITLGDQLYHAPNHDYHYQYCCDLSEYTCGNYYLKAIEISGKTYICPINAQNIVVIEENKVSRLIRLKRETEQMGAFANAWNIGDFLFLVPWKYPAIVRYNIRSNQIDYLQGYQEFFTDEVNGEQRIGGSCVWKQYLFLASPIDSRVLAVDSKTMKVQVLSTGSISQCGCMLMMPDEAELWLLPYTGTTITRWNPETGAVNEYSEFPEGFQCINRLTNEICNEKPFSRFAFTEEQVVLSPYYGNMFISINKNDGTISKWVTPFDIREKSLNGYFQTNCMGTFQKITGSDEWNNEIYLSNTDRKLYEVNLNTNEYREINIEFNLNELRKKTPGFGCMSEWIQYGCNEGAFHSLNQFLNGDLEQSFQKKRQLQAFENITANISGTSGETIHQFAKQKMRG